MPAWALNVEGRYIAEFIRGVFHSGAIYNGIDRRERELFILGIAQGFIN